MMQEDESFDNLVREKLNAREFQPSDERRAKAYLAIDARNAEKSSRFRIGFIFLFLFVTAGIFIGTYYSGGADKNQHPVQTDPEKPATLLPADSALQHQTEIAVDHSLNNESREKDQSVIAENKSSSSETLSDQKDKNSEIVNSPDEAMQKKNDEVKPRNEVSDSYSSSNKKYKPGQKKNDDFQKTNSVSDLSNRNAAAKTGNDYSLIKPTQRNAVHADPNKNSTMNSRSSEDYTDSVKMKSYQTDYSDAAKMKSYITEYSNDSIKMKSYETQYSNDSLRMNSYHTNFADDSVKMKTYQTEYKNDSASNNTVNTNSASRNQGGSVNYFFIEAGATFIPGFSPGFRSGRSINPVLGAGYCFRIGMKTSLQAALHYTFIGNVSDSTLIYTNTTFGFSSQTEYTEVNLKRLHYASVPLTFIYHLNSKNAFNAGMNINYLFTTEIHLHTYSDANSDISSVSKFGYLQGINRFDFQFAGGYARTFGPHWSAEISLYAGLMDIKKNSFYGVNKFERNKGLQFTIQYAF
jgi:hypothetical protein